jgi:hypothetical protein
VTDIPRAVLIDTSTVLDLALHDPDAIPDLDTRGSAAVESMVLFERVYLDARTARADVPSFDWLDELDDGVEFVNDRHTEVEDTYARALRLAEHVVMSGDTADLVEGGSRTAVWDEIPSYSRVNSVPRPVADFVERMVEELRLRRPDGAMILVRLCYYLALQERLGSLLLLHPSKAYDQRRPEFGYAGRILDVFDSKVRTAYLERRQEWLGEPVPEVRIPLLASYVLTESARRGWSLGRTISWLRTRPEVRLFREGMTELLARVEAKDNAAVDGILTELEQAAEAWARKLGTKPATRTVSLQVSIPIVSPSFAVPIPKLRKTPAQKLLVLVDQLLR